MAKHHKPVKPPVIVPAVIEEPTTVITPSIDEVLPPEIAICPEEIIAFPEEQIEMNTKCLEDITGGYVIINPEEETIVQPIESRSCETCECGTHFDDMGNPLLDSSLPCNGDIFCIPSLDILPL